MQNAAKHMAGYRGLLSPDPLTIDTEEKFNAYVDDLCDKLQALKGPRSTASREESAPSRNRMEKTGRDRAAAQPALDLTTDADGSDGE